MQCICHARSNSTRRLIDHPHIVRVPQCVVIGCKVDPIQGVVSAYTIVALLSVSCWVDVSERVSEDKGVTIERLRIPRTRHDGVSMLPALAGTLASRGRARFEICLTC
jgi:hypothetical protein